MLKRLLICVVMISVLTGCGFHLRGLNEVPSWLNPVAIVVQDAHRDLGPILKAQLESFNIEVVANPEQAHYLLIIEADGIQQQMMSVAASTVPRQYLLIYDVQFRLVKVKGGLIVPSRHVVVTRQLTINSNKILGSNSEETQLSYEMRREAAIQVVTRVGRESRRSH